MDYQANDVPKPEEAQESGKISKAESCFDETENIKAKEFDKNENLISPIIERGNLSPTEGIRRVSTCPEVDSTVQNSATVFNKSKDSQEIIETINKSLSRSERSLATRGGNKELNLGHVDWLGLPLTKSTLPDFVSTTKLHYNYPSSSSEAVPPNNVTKDSKTPTQTENQSHYKQFPGIGWKSPSLYPERAIRGSVKKASQVSEILPHPKTSVWHVTKSQLERLRKKDPMEYLNLLDPSNVIPTEKAIYQWLIRDQGEIGKGITVGESCVSSGFLRNRKPHIPPSEQRDFRSIYRKSFCEIPARNEIEGLESIDPQNYAFPGYGVSTTMRDVPSSFMSFGEHLLKSEPDFRRPYRRASSAKPKL